MKTPQEPENQSEVKAILGKIQEEYESATAALHGLAQGTCRHTFITARMENMQKLHVELQHHVGDVAIALIAERLEDAPNTQT
jgi:hypothetical protein